MMFRIRQFVSFICLLSIVLHPAMAVAITESDRHAINYDTTFYDSNYAQCVTSTQAADSNLSGNSAAQKAYNYFVSPPISLPPNAAAGIVGNLMVESSRDGRSAELDTHAHNDIDGGHTGIAQWSAGRWANLVKFAGGKSPYSLAVQLDFIWEELTTTFKDSTLAAIKTAQTPEDAASIFNNGPPVPAFEASGPTGNDAQRRENAGNVLREYGQGGGTVSNAAPTSTSNAATDCLTYPSCDKTSGGKADVVLDPGHSKDRIEETDPESGVKALDYNNPTSEMADVWDVAQKVKTALESDGYSVLLTKKKEDDTVGLLERAKIANDANPEIAVSIHTSPGGTEQNLVTPQEVGRYRQNVSDGKKKVFEDAKLAATSQQYADKIAEARKTTQGAAHVGPLDFNGRNLPAVGNISLSQLFSKVPWVYNESAQTGLNKDKYAEGLIKGIEAAVKPSGDKSGSTNTCAPNGSIQAAVQLAMQYAWPDYQSPYLVMKQEYKAAVAKAQREHRYVGGGIHPGIDCGGFITQVMQNSGADPEYNGGDDISKQGNTIGQQDYMKSHPEKYESLGVDPPLSKLKPGDIAINGQHTYMYVGPVKDHPNFHGNAASSSYLNPWRTPMADNVSNGYNWYRLKAQ